MPPSLTLQPPPPSRTSPLGARLEWLTGPSATLGIMKTFGIYLPPGYGQGTTRYPVLYLFRGHEDEWAGDQDGREGLVPLLDRLIGGGIIPPIVVVLPGLMEPGRRHQGAPVNWSEVPKGCGAGSGRFEDYFFELKGLVESGFRVLAGKEACFLDGFSMGGMSAVMLATRYPHLFASAGAYDGSFMWKGQVDPRRKGRGRSDRLWFSEACAPFFRRRRRWNVAKMEQHNPVWQIERARGARLEQLRAVRFHLRCAASEANGNVDRTAHVASALERRRIPLTFAGPDLTLDPGARHDWLWADRHLEATLPLHLAR